MLRGDWGEHGQRYKHGRKAGCADGGGARRSEGENTDRVRGEGSDGFNVQSWGLTFSEDQSP